MSDAKVCTKCKEEKPRSEFYKNRRVKDGFQNQCKVCEKQYYQENREKILNRAKQHYQENREKILDYAKQHYQENKEKLPDYRKQYYQENKEKLSDYFKQHYQENKELYIERAAKRRALKIKAIPEALIDCPVEKGRLVQIYNLRDVLTKATGVEYHVDHIWPLSKGGPHWSGNLQIITAEENRSKHASFCEHTARVIQESLNENTSS